ncbi:branched-chain amino acid aminotransferase [Colletotrichum cuscutae]|uniref:Branched-chain amino acid aminotransferase n=1 Tax=Colletotrichum cuscutae TaxID=1209917 RepID=A0AAI9UHS5_9PEZI|nr:branched-chain amino acid aminotransferase [Colletotrichum cuscutae]
MASDLAAYPLRACELSYNLTSSPQPVPSEATILSSEQSICTDHMVVASWKHGIGWSKPELKPYGPLNLLPTASCLHYATECFEGLKAYRGHDGKLRVFRVEHNVARLRSSAARISLPTFEPGEVKKLAGGFVYVRPTIIGTSPQLGVQAPKKAMLFIVLAYMPRLDVTPGDMRLYSSPKDAVRAWVGGFGHAKIGANYGPSVLVLQEAADKGYHQVLWLYGEDGECTEAGGCNFFVVWVRKDGKTELITAPLDDKTILDGRKFTVTEIMEAAAEGRLLESFAAGTAYFISAVSHIHHHGHDISVAMGAAGKGAKITTTLKGWLTEIMYGYTEHPWATIVSTSWTRKFGSLMGQFEPG